jgi:hypothetical protein
MARSIIQSESINLADDFAFTGTVTGAGSNSGFRFIKKVTISSSNGTFSATDLFSTSYNFYKLFWELQSSVNNIANHFQWILSSDGSVDTTNAIDFRVDGTDNDGVARNKSGNDLNYWVIEDDDLENVHKHYMEMNVYDPMNATKTNVSGHGNYTVNINDDVVPYMYAAGTSRSVAYSGIHLFTSDTIGGSVSSSNTLTGRVLVYGFAES